MIHEETTVWEDGHCRRCGSWDHTMAEGGEYCDGCARRIERWLSQG